ncbi:hypothetical protein CK203_093033 [Vitis vinifera]|uniref:Uncharacterized protein n=1 Tax=Vitis vinifera TaxID=29760 RepID=A0A438CLD4_VITVI|nr:hypothetical protein CK203_093033 [Vitis vinifera]
MAGSGSSMLYSFLLFVVILSLQEMYRGKLASSELFTILGGFISSLIFLVLLTFIGNIQETCGMRTGWGAGNHSGFGDSFKAMAHCPVAMLVVTGCNTRFQDWGIICYISGSSCSHCCQHCPPSLYYNMSHEKGSWGLFEFLIYPKISNNLPECDPCWVEPVLGVFRAVKGLGTMSRKSTDSQDAVVNSEEINYPKTQNDLDDWKLPKLVGGVMRRLEWRVLNVHMTERALFCFPYWRENILAIITIILEFPVLSWTTVRA